MDPNSQQPGDEALDQIAADLRTGIDARNPNLTTALETTRQSLTLVDRLLGLVGLQKGPKKDDEEPKENEGGEDPGESAAFSDLQKGMMHTCSGCGKKEGYNGDMPEGLQKGPEALYMDDLLAAIGNMPVWGALAKRLEGVEATQALQAQHSDLTSKALQSFGAGIETLVKGPLAAAAGPTTPEIVLNGATAAEVQERAALAAIRAGQGKSGTVEPLTKGERTKGYSKGIIGDREFTFSDERIREIRRQLEAK